MTIEEIERRSDNGTVLESLSHPVTGRHRPGIHFESEDGYRARPLKRNQTALEECC
ncbi:hypothetical protein [Natrinema sp. DC36]|uniref:hypothetical protein n=1 Tax=Natrinema sp. DC36 TaxID=2878680 RepID=UPI001CF0D319|nr:hypothetical protein [Natrinema sp. DC36]